MSAVPGPWNTKPHTCHARFCETPVKPEMLMCAKHWRMVPRALQQDVWKNYRDGQCDDKQPSEAWHEAADAAIDAVLRKECAIAKAKPVTRGGFRP